MVLLCVAQFMVVLDVTIVAVALPSIQRSLGFAQADLQWVVSAYTLAFGGFLMFSGRAADLYGRRTLFMVGLALFASASLVCGLAGSPGLLVAARAAQGLGAAIVAPAALSILTATFPAGEERNRALGFWTAAQASGGAIGWVLGGVLSEGLGWEWVFFVNVPVGAVGVALAPVLLAESRDRTVTSRLDAWGAITITGGLALLVYGLAGAEEAGFGSFLTLGTLALAVALIAAFVLIERRVVSPLIPLKIFRSRNLVGANLAISAVNIATNAPLFLCILYLQGVLHRSPTETGLGFVPFNLSVITGSFLGARLTYQVGARINMTCGLSLIALGTLLFMGIGPKGGYLAHLLPGFVLMGVGVGLASVASTAAGTSAVGADKQGLVSGLLNTAAQIGTVLGLALLVPLSAARADALTGGAGDPPEIALVEGFRWAFFGGAGLAASFAILAFFLVREPERRVEPREPRDSRPRRDPDAHVEPSDARETGRRVE